MSYPENFPILMTKLDLVGQYFHEVDPDHLFTAKAEFGIDFKLEQLEIGDEFTQNFKFHLLLKGGVGDGVSESQAFKKRFELMDPNDKAEGLNYFERSELSFGYDHFQRGKGVLLELGLINPKDRILKEQLTYKHLGKFLNPRILKAPALSFPEHSGVGVYFNHGFGVFDYAMGVNLDVLDDSLGSLYWLRLGLHLFSESDYEFNLYTTGLRTNIQKATLADETGGKEYLENDASWNFLLSFDQRLGPVRIGLDYAHSVPDLDGGSIKNSLASRLILSGQLYGREKDLIAVGHIWVEKKKEEKVISEHGLELFYQLDLGLGINLMPNYQLLVNQDGEVYHVPALKLGGKW